MKTISIVTPVYNESENINDLCRTLDDFAVGKPYRLELIFVDDGSSDDSVALLSAWTFQNADAKIVTLSRNFGSHAAIRAGISIASGDYTMLFSGDLQEPVHLIDDLFNTITQGYDIVYVEKGNTQISFRERFFSHFFARLINKYTNSGFPAGGVNNFMMTPKVRKYFNANPELNSSVFLQLMDMGFKHTIIVCDYLERAKGESKWTLGKKIKAFIDSFIAFTFAPIRAVTILGLTLSAIGIIFVIIILIIRIFNIFPFETGFPTIISVMLIGFGLTNISLGIIAEYLWRTLDASRGRPGFIIDSVTEKQQKGDSDVSV